MKRCFIFCIVLILYACSENKKLVSKGYSIQDICQSFASKYTNVLQDIKAECRFIASRSPKKGNKSRPFAFFCATVDKYDYNWFPYYELDLKEFDKNPREENIQNCISSSTNTINIVAEKNGEIRARLIAREGKNGKWFRVRCAFEFDRTMNWLRDSLYRAGNQDFKIFSVREEEFISYQGWGKNLYFKMTGEPIPAEQFREYLTKVYNHGYIPYEYRPRPANTGIIKDE